MLCSEFSDASSSEDDGEEVTASSGGILVLPSLPSDRLRKADAMPADVMHGIVSAGEGWPLRGSVEPRHAGVCCRALSCSACH